MYLAKNLRKYAKFSPEWFEEVKSLLDHFYEWFIEEFEPFGQFEFEKEETPFGWAAKINGMPGTVTCSVQTNFDLTLLKPNGETKLYDNGNNVTKPAHDLLCVSTGLDSPTMDERYFKNRVKNEVTEAVRLNELPDFEIEYLGVRPKYNYKGNLYSYENAAILTSSAFKGRKIIITSYSAYIDAYVEGCCHTDIVYGTAILLDDVNGGEYETYDYREKLKEKREAERLAWLREHR